MPDFTKINEILLTEGTNLLSHSLKWEMGQQAGVGMAPGVQTECPMPQSWTFTFDDYVNVSIGTHD